MGGAISASDAFATEIADVTAYCGAVLFEEAEADFLADYLERGLLGCLVFESVDLGVVCSSLLLSFDSS